MLKKFILTISLVLIASSAFGEVPNLKKFAVRGLNANEKTTFQASYDEHNLLATLSGSFQRFFFEENKTYTYEFKIMQNFGGDPQGEEKPFPGGYVLEIANPLKAETQFYTLGSDSKPNELTFYRPVLAHDPNLFKNYKTIEVIRFGFFDANTIYVGIGQGTIYCTAESANDKEFKYCGWGGYDPASFTIQPK